MTLSSGAIERLLQPYIGTVQVPDKLFTELLTYLHLLMKWNARTNLTAIRDPEEIVRRHFGESLFTGLHLPAATTLLDFGSGAGFPGLPIQLLRPELAVTLSESQNKKASFLRETIRTLGLKTAVWGGRVETMPEDRLFDVVTIRAVDNMQAATASAALRVRTGGTLAILTQGSGNGIPIPNTESALLELRRY